MTDFETWRAATSRHLSIRANHRMLNRVDSFLRGYARGNPQVGDWKTRIHPLILFIQEINSWMKDPRNRADFLFQHLGSLWESATLELRILMAHVPQGYYQTFAGQHNNRRFVCTTGAMSCMVVILYDRDCRVATLGHLYARMMIDGNGKATAADNVRAMVGSFIRARGSQGMGSVVGYILAGRLTSDRPESGGGSKRDLLVEALKADGIQVIDWSFSSLSPGNPANVAFDRESGHPTLFQPSYDNVLYLGMSVVRGIEGNAMLEVPAEGAGGAPTKPW